MKKRKNLRTATTPSAQFKPRLFFVLFATSLFLIPLLSAPLHSKDKKPIDYALIFGTVWSPNDRPVYGMRVKLRRANEKKNRWEAYSNRRGEFEFRVPVGKMDYVLSADSKGFKLPDGKKLQVSPEVTVHIESNERADTGLHLK